MPKYNYYIILSCVSMFLATQACRDKSNNEVNSTANTEEVTAELIEEIVASEEVISELTTQLNQLGRGVKSKKLPADVHITGVIEGDSAELLEGVPVAKKTWKLGGANWNALFAQLADISEAKLGVYSGRFGETRNDFELKAKFTAKATDQGGRTVGLKGVVLLSWKKVGETWKLTDWNTKKLVTLGTPATFFRDVTSQATGGSEKATTSLHDKWISLLLQGKAVPFPYGKKKNPYLIMFDSLEQHVGVSVVDIDRDGWDDFYVMARWGENQLWRNRGDGTYEEIGRDIGLNIDGMCTSAVFADFDNDGDTDLFVGRSLERCAYYRNDNGRFSDQTSALVSEDLPYLCSSVCAADYNGDGLLDIYISTYIFPYSKVPQEIWTKDFLTPEQVAEWKERRKGDHPTFHLTSMPNMLLINKGGRFELAPEQEDVALWLCTLQSSWSDYDGDGDPDLFIANDYGPDLILRNDKTSGDKRRFVDVTHSLVGDEMHGFGMGISFGDYDNDGRRDLFMTYMYSKAGSRITKQFPKLDRRTIESARGNKLFRFDGKAYELASGAKPPKLQVSATGWSWGGQFADMDNDGDLDLYVLNGYYTAPKEVASEKDL